MRVTLTPGWKHAGMRVVRVAARYVPFASFVRAWRSRRAIFATAATRSAISARVNPSGKTMWNGFAIAITVSTVPVAVVLVTVR